MNDKDINQDIESIFDSVFSEEDEEVVEVVEEVTEVEATEEVTEETTEEAEEVTEEVEEEVETTEEVTEVVTPLEDLTIKYLHEEKALKDIPREELQTLVQKGLNHDRVNEKLTGLKDTLSGFQELAEFYGHDVNKLQEVLFNQYYVAKAKKDGTTPEIVRKEYELTQREKSLNKPNEQNKAFDTLLKTYPDVKATDIKEQTWDKFADGVDLVTAYQLQIKDTELNDIKSQFAKMQNEIKVLRQNQEVKKKAPVKATSNNGTKATDMDDFMAGFLGK